MGVDVEERGKVGVALAGRTGAAVTLGGGVGVALAGMAGVAVTLRGGVGVAWACCSPSEVRESIRQEQKGAVKHKEMIRVRTTMSTERAVNGLSELLLEDID